jgi:DNA-binding NtrC family response regulator
VQARLLRLLEEGVLLRVGGADERPADVRVIASANRPMEPLVENGGFREDLFYRLNVLNVRVPPLSERAEDIEALARGLLTRIAEEHGLPRKQLDAEAVTLLEEAEWPRHLLELANALERAFLSAEGGTVGPEHFLLPARGIPAAMAAREGDSTRPPRTLRAAEEACIRRVLCEEGGNRSRTARVLGINRTTLYKKLREYAIDRPSAPDSPLRSPRGKNCGVPSETIKGCRNSAERGR